LKYEEVDYMRLLFFKSFIHSVCLLAEVVEEGGSS
jgi:hypothetical protein